MAISSNEWKRPFLEEEVRIKFRNRNRKIDYIGAEPTEDEWVEWCRKNHDMWCESEFKQQMQKIIDA